jgi:hypothetical protein
VVTAILSAIAALPTILTLLKEILAVFGPDPQAKMIEMGNAFKKLRDAKEPQQYADAAKDIQEAIRKR